MLDWATIGVSIGSSVLGSVLVTEYRLRREQSVEESAEIEQWYDQSATFAAQARRTWQQLFDEPESHGRNLEEIQNKLKLLHGQISRHASEGEQINADQQVIDALDDLATECKRPSEYSLHMDSVSDFQEFREDTLNAVSNVERSLEDK